MRNAKGQFIKGFKQTEETKQKIREALRGANNYLFGKHPSIETRRRMSESQKGNKNKLGKHLSEETKYRLSQYRGIRNSQFGKKRSEEWKQKMSIKHTGKVASEETRRKLSESHKGKQLGSKNPSWKGGITPLNAHIRNSFQGRLWAKAVKERDSFTDQKTGIRGGKLVSHHILNFVEYPELRFAIDNGITLSDKSHREFHSRYGKTHNTREQLEEFLKS